MPSDHRSATRRLLRAARPLKPATEPYYVHNPRPPQERFGPGWYWGPEPGQPPEYLGYNSIEAEITLRELLRATASPAMSALGALVELVS